MHSPVIARPNEAPLPSSGAAAWAGSRWPERGSQGVTRTGCPTITDVVVSGAPAGYSYLHKADGPA